MASTEIEYKDGQQERGGMGGRLRNFKKGIYDSEQKTIVGRTGSSWAKIGVFYLIYYICLAAFFAVSLVIFFTTVDDNQPSQTGYDSLIKSNPGMAFRPMPDIESTLIRFHQGQPHSYQRYTDNIKAFLAKYKATHENQENCAGGKPSEGKVCKFDIDEQFGEDCSEKTDFGYHEGKPCVLLKINRVYDWEPKPLENKTLENELEGHDVSDEGVYVTCEGENPSDIDNLGKVDVYPGAGFLKNFFPYKNIKGYQSPVVFVRMSNLKSGIITQVWCKAWAGNIKHHKNDKAGSTHFELLMD